MVLFPISDEKDGELVKPAMNASTIRHIVAYEQGFLKRGRMNRRGRR